MQHPVQTGSSSRAAPTFYLTARQPLRPGAILLAVIAASGALGSIAYALRHNGHRHPDRGGPGAGRYAVSAQDANPADDDKDDPSQVDTIVLGDPADAPVPGRRGDHVSPVHPTILVSLPRFGDQVGLIPDTPAGRLLYGWLAAFNEASYPALGNCHSKRRDRLLDRCPDGTPPPDWRLQPALRPKKSFLVSSFFVCVIRLHRQSRSSAPCRFCRTPTRPPLQASASAPSPRPTSRRIAISWRRKALSNALLRCKHHRGPNRVCQRHRYPSD